MVNLLPALRIVAFIPPVEPNTLRDPPLLADIQETTRE
jgi:hypothetical protein